MHFYIVFIVFPYEQRVPVMDKYGKCHEVISFVLVHYIPFSRVQQKNVKNRFTLGIDKNLKGEFCNFYELQKVC